jgi:hypothetical protein
MSRMRIKWIGGSNLGEDSKWKIFLYNQQLVNGGRVETYSYDVIYRDLLLSFLKKKYRGVFGGGLLQY